MDYKNCVYIKDVNNEIETNLNRYVKYCEEDYKKQIFEIVSHVKENKNTKFVLLAGPSSSGKTTTARLLGEYFNSFDLKAKVISLDDFFVNRVDTPKWENGKYNYETVDAIDWKLFDECVNNLLKNGYSKMPTYNFITGEKEFNYETTLAEDEIIIIEGLHSLNPIIDNFIPTNLSVKVYLSPRVNFLDENGNEVIDGKQMRFFRRLIRDAFTRGSSPEHTLQVWPDVKLGEKLYIDPFKNQADYHINSCHNYEVGVYKSILKELNLLEDPILLPYTKLLEKFDMVDKDIVPSSSLLTEFVH